MSSVVDLASQIISDDYSRVSPLLRLIVQISDDAQDPLKAANRSELIKYLCAQTPEFDSLCDSLLRCADQAADRPESIDETELVDEELSEGATH